ncbi:hypothetical protein C3747_25g203 [Trypanosoma cruzi]|uniref:Uncharacterized protein n=1 Tax=Trypanosoma cruzi TaxID=5693 RepID=A0A2V2X5V8_TRYCR|nr:hypothetical protein C3747_25g203 [Trypanosoma cruzi]
MYSLQQVRRELRIWPSPPLHRRKMPLVMAATPWTARGNEYLLQTAINAYQCQVLALRRNTFSRARPAADALHERVLFCALLQHAITPWTLLTGQRRFCAGMKERGSSYHPDHLRLMKIYLRIESPKLLELISMPRNSLGTFRRRGLTSLLLWRSTSLRTHPWGKKYILDEVQRVHGIRACRATSADYAHSTPFEIRL